MKATIDKAGRLVIPAPIRERARFTPGTELDVSVDDFGVHLTRSVPGPRLVKEGGGWVAEPTVPPEAVPEIDWAHLIEAERDRWPW